MKTFDRLLASALELSVNARAEMAGVLLESIPPPPGLLALPGTKEIARRMREVDSGKVRTVPWEEVRRQLEARIHAPRKTQRPSRCRRRARPSR